jgi:hypothetical protein
LQTTAQCGSVGLAGPDKAGSDCRKNGQPGSPNEKLSGFLFPPSQVPVSLPNHAPVPSQSLSVTHERAQAELDDTPLTPRFDDNQARQTLTLETRGLTPQREFWRDREIWSASIVAKLREVNRPDLWIPLDGCHKTEWIAECTQCRRIRRFYNRCEISHCPMCQARLARERAGTVEWWTQRIDQPKHIVLTVRNTDQLTNDYVRWFKHCWSRLRRSSFAAAWQGGFYSLEVTNEGHGWHLHLHALIDARWVDQKELAIRWANIVGQDFAIVKVKDVRGSDYIREVTKYTVKGNDLAAWSAPDIAAYIDAMAGVRSFGVFGKLYSQRTAWRKWLDTLQAEKPACECGCTTAIILSPDEYAWRLETRHSCDEPMAHEAPRAQPSLFA